jgi:hypothetical protein
MANKIKESNITDGAITSDKIAPGTIATDRLATDPTNASNIASGTLANARLTGSGALTINGTSIALGASGDIVAGTDWQSVKTSDFTAVAGEGYFVNTTSGAITVTLPASPSAGATVALVDYAGTFNTYNLTVNRNGSNIQGAATNATLSTNLRSTSFVYSDATKGWIPVNDNTTANYGIVYTEATGGTETTSGNFKIHTFNSSSNFVVSQVGNSAGGSAVVSYLVVAGGGGGANIGGGGAGGFREGRAANDSYTVSPLNAPAGITVSAQTYPITVGAGGTVGPAYNAKSRGSNSVFSTITSAGGGAGQGNHNPGPQPQTDGPGGSGGGGNSGDYTIAAGTGNTPPVSPAQGTDGGTASNGSGSNWKGAGGGGATVAGADADNNSTPGGTEATTHITGSPVAYAGGGGGGSYQNNAGNASPGGTGGRGGGTSPNRGATAGSANTGGGGGGQGLTPSGNGQPDGAGTGGSGVVIIRYKYQN